jgi:tRNA(Arg) A34 adenosine deaminase TadA
LATYWSRHVKELVLVPATEFKAGQCERHRLYSLLTMALVACYWNGNKYGQEGFYPWREKQRHPSRPGYVGGDYLGHNIASIAVDGQGEVIDFDFNHNEILASSVEHAESRLIRRVFSLTQLFDDWDTTDPVSQAGTKDGNSKPAKTPYSTLLNRVTIYTSLESCSQCSGIMALGSVKEVIFLHRDPGQNSIGNILYNLRPQGERYLPPLPIPADTFGLSYFEELNSCYERFAAELKDNPDSCVFLPDDPDKKRERSPSVTSFLCTDLAYDVFERALQEFTQLTEVQYPDFTPPQEEGQPKPHANAWILQHLQRFLRYAIRKGQRGTPHKL